MSARTGHHWADEPRRRLGWPGVLVALALSCSLVVLVPAADAAPPDPTWMGGIYDAADYDDVVALVGFLESLADGGLVTAKPPVSMVTRLTAATRGGAFAAEPPPNIQPRAPPQS